jgi:DsbC/DsbD-like thiol-disulfide interchange protein
LRIETRIPGSAARAAFACLALAAGWLGAARPAAAVASPWIANPQSQVRLISDDLVAPRQGELRLGIHFRLAPGWHAYWKNSGDAGFAPVVTWKDVPGLAPPELLWPAPHRFELPGGLEAFGYADEVVYPVRAAITPIAGSAPIAGAAPIAAGGRRASLRLAANVDYLVCKVDCVPHRYDLVLDQPLGERAEVDPRTAPLLHRWWRQVPLSAGRRAGPAGTPALASRAEMTLARTAAPGELRLALRLRGVTAAPGGADLFFESHPALELGRPRARAAAGGLLFEVPARRKDTSVPLPAITAIAWTATGLERDGQDGGPAPLALAARQEVAIQAAEASAPVSKPSVPDAEASAPAATAPAAPAQGAAPPRRAEAAPTGPERRVRGFLAAGDPRVVALAAVAAALLTLEAWGLLRLRPRRSTAAAAPVAAAPVRRREAAGFLALLVTLCLLYALSLEISAEGLAGVELALLAMSLVAWLRRRIERPGLARLLLAAALAACTIVPPWLAGRNRLAADPAALRGASLTVGSGHAAGGGGPFSFTTSTTVSNRRSFDA